MELWPFVLTLCFELAVAQALIKRTFAQSNNVPASIPMFLSYLLGVVPVSIVVGLVVPHSITWNRSSVILLVIEGAFIALYSWFSYRAMKLLPAALFQTIFQLCNVIVILLGWTLLREKLSALQVGGAVLLLCAGLLAIWAPTKAHKQGLGKYPDFRLGVILTLLSAVTMGIGLVAEKAALNYMDIGAYFIYGFGMQLVFQAIIAYPDLQRVGLKKISKETYRQSIIIGLLSVAIGCTYIYALNAANNISLVTALKAFVLPLTAIAAHKILKEHDDDRLLWTAIAIAVAGLILIAL